MRKKFTPLTILLVLLAGFGSYAQKTFPRDGVYDDRDGLYAFTNGVIFKSFNEKLDKATLIIRNGKIEAVGVGLAIPKEAAVIELKGKYIYPSFIETFGVYGTPETKPEAPGQGRRNGQQDLSSKKGAYNWNEAVRSEIKTVETFQVNEKAAEELRNIGFGTVSTCKMDGVSRGASVIVTLKNDRENNVVVKPLGAHYLSFQKGSSTQTYPTSLMGSIALLRQTYLDGQWYSSEGRREEQNLSLEAWNSLASLPQIFEVGDKLEALRAIKIAKEFNQKYIIKGHGDEYQRLDAMKATGASFILPLNFPDGFDVEDPYDAALVSLTDLKHWELAPANPGRMSAAGIEFALTAYGLKDKKDFLKNLQKAVEYGLSEEEALRALTATPAKLLGISDMAGSLEKGKLANFIITSGSIFDKSSIIYQNWAQGKGYTVKDIDAPTIAGVYLLTGASANNYTLTIDDKNAATLSKEGDTAKIKGTLKAEREMLMLSFTPAGEKAPVRLSGTISGKSLQGRGQSGAGDWLDWKADRTGDAKPAAVKSKDQKTKPELGDVTYPFVAFGRKTIPEGASVLFKNATVWTNEDAGVLKNTDVLIQYGKIAQVGKNLTAGAGVSVVDATNKHLTAGIIDEHSHIAASKGINEGSQSCTSEVRIEDVLNSEDINIYRQLAGGVTSSHILHGSANSIGGQTQLIKLRWGFKPDDLKFAGSDPFIKFALGENVKQSNWGINNTRFPQTRMGVEQVFEDHFSRAEDYIKLKASGKTYRKDLELEALAEILQKKRFITCHSYVQSEINMLMKVAERHNFNVNTFTHILEGYKVADKMKAHGAGGSTFSDWWAYKFEVYEAIPYNGSMMHDQGVVVAFNSDDAEMARRLNQEAAKAVEYGKTPQEEAWKFVTLNPAKLLHVDQKTGSIKVGKDADVVVWSDNPLSVYAKAEQTYVDGIKFFDRQEDVKMQEEVRHERARLISKLLKTKKEGAQMAPVAAQQMKLYHCDDVEVESR